MKGGRFRGARRSSRGVNSKEWWGAQLGANNVASVTQAGWVIDPPTAADQFESPTLIRVIVAVSATNDAITVDNNNFGFGLYVASGDEDDVTVPTPVWDPLDDQPSDWVYRWVATVPNGIAARSIVYSNGGADITIDVRTKRKIPKGHGLLATFQSRTTGAGEVTFDAAADVRVLLISG